MSLLGLPSGSVDTGFRRYLICDMVQPSVVIPAKAGIHSLERRAFGARCAGFTQWIPACAGMTVASDMVQPSVVIPANAGIHSLERRAFGARCAAFTRWIPACAGMTVACVCMLSFVANQAPV